MGQIDISMKKFLKINTVFAQLFSEGLYHGSVDIDPEGLKKLDTAKEETLKWRTDRSNILSA